MRDTYYFSHDYNTRTDSKIKRLIARHGMTGYGIYWAIVEDLYQNANALPTDYESIAFDMRTDIPTLTSIVNDFDLFRVDTNSFGSMSVQRRLDEREEKSTKARDSAVRDGIRMRTHCKRKAKAMLLKERKGKRNERKRKKVSIPPPPLIEDVIAYFKENKYTEASARKAFDYYKASITDEKPYWSDGKGNPIKNWKMKMQSVWFKDENKETEKPAFEDRNNYNGNIRFASPIL
jgi:hypothetical protein